MPLPSRARKQVGMSLVVNQYLSVLYLLSACVVSVCLCIGHAILYRFCTKLYLLSREDTGRNDMQRFAVGQCYGDGYFALFTRE